jgi:serine/threonine protein kinase
MAGPHDKILQDYQNVELLKEGGQKAAYLATDPTHGRVVVKIGRYPSASSLERIRREVDVLRDIVSPYYPKNIDFRVEPPDLFVVVEEFVESRPLSDCVEDFEEAKTALALLKEIITGLTVLWDKRIVHRDIKPENVLILPDTSPKIIDLGIARLLDEESLTKTINARGPCTPAYASPAQLKNRKAQIDQRTDQFSLGILLVQLLLRGAHPFDPNVVRSGDSIVANILAGHWCRAELQKKAVPICIQELAAKLLGAEPFRRFRNAEAILTAIAACEAEVQ